MNFMKLLNMIKKKSINLIKNKTGSLISVCMVFPLWLLLLFIMTTEVSNHQRLLTLTETNQVVSRIVQTAPDFQTCNTKITEYIKNSKLGIGGYYYSDTTNSYIFNITVKNERGASLTQDEYMSQPWGDKWLITYSIKVYTPSYMSRVNKISIGSQSYTIMDESFTISSTVITL